ncbi:MazG-like family protein [Streptomyces roseifaciens]
MDSAAWTKIETIIGWIDDQSPLDDPMQTLSMRMHKIYEEAGEASQAFIGATAYNPRKGQSHTMDDVKKELCDLIITTMVALRTVDPDAEQTFAANLERVTARSTGSAKQPAAD